MRWSASDDVGQHSNRESIARPIRIELREVSASRVLLRDPPARRTLFARMTKRKRLRRLPDDVLLEIDLARLRVHCQVKTDHSHDEHRVSHCRTPSTNNLPQTRIPETSNPITPAPAMSHSSETFQRSSTRKVASAMIAVRTSVIARVART